MNKNEHEKLEKLRIRLMQFKILNISPAVDILVLQFFRV